MLNSNNQPQDRVVVSQQEGSLSHQDIGSITPNDGIIINRTKDLTSPFVPIQKRLLSSGTGTAAGICGVEIEDLNTDTGWMNVGNVSERYLLIPNREFYELMVELAGRTGFPFEVSRIYWDGKRFAVVIDFRDVWMDVEDGDDVCLSLFARQSYDKSWVISASFMGKRFACDNGMISGEFFANVNFKHLEGQDHWTNVIEDGLALVNHAQGNLKRFVRGLRALKRIQVDDQTLRTCRNEIITPKHLGPSTWGKVMDHYWSENEEPSYYGLLNAATHVFWHNREKMTAADFKNNDVVVSRLLGYALDNVN